eukprot:2944545-Rhodomonas_salina.2
MSAILFCSSSISLLFAASSSRSFSIDFCIASLSLRVTSSSSLAVCTTTPSRSEHHLASSGTRSQAQARSLERQPTSNNLLEQGTEGKHRAKPADGAQTSLGIFLRFE